MLPMLPAPFEISMVGTYLCVDMYGLYWIRLINMFSPEVGKIFEEYLTNLLDVEERTTTQNMETSHKKSKFYSHFKNFRYLNL